MLPWIEPGDVLVDAFVAGDAKRTAEHFEAKAEDAERNGDWAGAWDAWYRHVHQAPRPRVDDETIADRYARIADAAGYTSFAKILTAR